MPEIVVVCYVNKNGVRLNALKSIKDLMLELKKRKKD